VPEGYKKRLDTAVRSLEARGRGARRIHEYDARLEYEIGIIEQMNYAGYFLIVWTSSNMRGTMGFRWVRARIGSGVAGGRTRWKLPISIPLQTLCCLNGF